MWLVHTPLGCYSNRDLASTPGWLTKFIIGLVQLVSACLTTVVRQVSGFSFPSSVFNLFLFLTRHSECQLQMTISRHHRQISSPAFLHYQSTQHSSRPCSASVITSQGQAEVWQPQNRNVMPFGLHAIHSAAGCNKSATELEHTGCENGVIETHREMKGEG